MGRLRAFLYASGVTFGVFAYLALPLLRQMYGPMVDLPVFGVIALVTGLLTYVGVRRIQSYVARTEERNADANEVLIEGEVFRVGSGVGTGDGGGDEDGGREDGTDRPNVDVDVEMEQLKDDK